MLKKISSDIVQSIESFTCTPDDKIIFVVNLKDAFSPLSSIENYKYIETGSSVSGVCIGSESYFISVSGEEKGANNDSVSTGNITSKIYLLNRKTSNKAIIKVNFYAFRPVIYGSELCFVNYIDNAPDSIIYIDLKENGF